LRDLAFVKLVEELKFGLLVQYSNVMYNLFRFYINNFTLHKEETIVKYYILLEIPFLQKERRKIEELKLNHVET